MASSGKGVQVSLAPNTSYRAEDLVTERKFKGEHDEYLVKWVLQPPPAPEKPKYKEQNPDEEAHPITENIKKEYCMWMRREEIEACCPHLLAFKPTPSSSSQTANQASNGGEGNMEEDMDPASTGLTLEKEEALSEMKADVRLLIGRAKKLMNPSMGGGKVLSNTVNILNAYAKIGLLTESFQEYGAVDLLLGLLGFPDLDVRKNSSAMLRSLTAYNRSIRGYVLLRLIRSDEESSKSSLQSRQMLLDLFSETASSDESDVRGIAFPQASPPPLPPSLPCLVPRAHPLVVVVLGVKMVVLG